MDAQKTTHIPLRELRNYASRVVRRARAGERMVITVDGVPAAEIGPVKVEPEQRTLRELIAAGLVIPPRRSDMPALPRPVPAPAGRSTLEILREHREQREQR
jgi:prevent-host-death family protein